jgi:hypothetical protein
MGLLDDVARVDNAAFDDPDAFGEPVVYTNSAGAQFNFNCLITRGSLTPIAQNEGGAARRPIEAPETTASIPYDPAGKTGLPSKPLRHEKITFALNAGEDPTEHLVLAILLQGSARWKVRIR